jgi:phenylpropionate dioxygenase-like ring-hydroxylating dioxygenase large terminal subunit
VRPEGWHPDERSVSRDYDQRTLLPFWQLTAEQDWQICARQQLGVCSPAYVPGPLSPAKEYNVMAFHACYLRALADPEGPDSRGRQQPPGLNLNDSTYWTVRVGAARVLA